MSGGALAERRAELARKWRETLAALRTKIGVADRRRRWANAHAVVAARRSRRALRARMKERRAHERARINRELGELVAKSRRLLAARKAHIRTLGLTTVQRARHELAAKRAQHREHERAKRWAWKEHKKADRRMTALERRRHSDDEVRSNIEPELVPVFEAVKRSLRVPRRTTRTEAFSEWVEGHSGEVWAIQERNAERAVSKLLEEEKKLGKRTHPPSARRQARTLALLEAVPF